MNSSGEMIFDARIDASGFKKDTSKLGDIVKGLSVFELIKKGLNMVAQSIGDAVSRYDTLTRFSPIMQQMGYSAQDADASISKLSKGIQGLPTTLDGIVSNTKQLALATGSLDTGTDSALALNNAFLASGASVNDAGRGMVQYIQMLSSGKVDMLSWRTLQETMPYALQKTAEAFEFTGETARTDLYAALRDGDITFSQFNAQLINLNGGVGGFAEVAKTATGGIGTAWTNMQTAVVRGTTGIITSIDTGLSATRFGSIENIITGFGKGFEAVLKGIASAAKFTVTNIVPVTAGVIAFGVAVKGVQLLSLIGQMGSVTAALTKMTPAIVASTVAKAKDLAQTVILTAMYAKDTVVKGLSTIATMAETAANKRDIAVKGGSIAATIAQSVATGVATAAQWLLNAAMLASPVGLVIAGIVALTAAIVALVVWINSSTDEYRVQKEEVEALAEKQGTLTTTLKDSSNAHSENMSAINGSIQAGQTLLSTLMGMVDENGRLTASHEDAGQAIADLNKAYEGLNLAYDEETGYLSASVEEIEKYISAKNNLSRMSALDERRVALTQEQAQLEANLAEATAKRDLISQDANLTERDKRKLYEELDKTIRGYEDTQNSLSLDIQANNAAIASSTDTMAQNTVNAYEAINGARTADGLNLKQLAKLYGTTTEQILADMEAQGISMEGWAAKKAASMTEDGLNLEQLAAKWGMTTEEVTAYMDEWGLSLDDFDKEMTETHTAAGLSLEQLAAKWGTSTEEIKAQMAAQGISMQEWSDNQDAKTQDVINSFSEIPGEYEKTANDLINVLKTNAERYSAWTENIATLSQTMSAEAIAELQKLGPEANSAIEEMIADPAKAAEFEESILAVMSAGAGGAEVGATDPRFAEAGGQIGRGVGEGIAESGEVEAAATQMVNNTYVAAETAVASGSFLTIGQRIATEIVNGVKNSDMSGISSALTTAVQAGASSVNSALSSMSSQMQSQFTGMKSSADNTITQMMTGVVSGITARQGAAKTAATGVSNGVTTAFTDMKTKSDSLVSQMMTAFVSGITSRQGAARSAAQGVASGVTSEFEAMGNKSETLVEQMMNAVVRAIKNGTESAKTAASGVVDAIIASIKNKDTDAYNAGKSIGQHMADGMVAGLDAGKGSVYAKADEIAKEAARRIKAALEINSPSRVTEDIFQNVVLGMVAGLEDEERGLFRAVDAMAGGVVERLNIIPEGMAAVLNNKLRLAVSANQEVFARIPAVATAGEGAINNSHVYNFYQTIHSDKYMSPADNARAAEALLRKSKYQIK